MADSVQVAVYEGGELKVHATGEKTNEVVLALGAGRILAKVVRVGEDEDAAAIALPQLQSMSPYPDEPLTVGVETLRESGEGRIVLAAALPEGAADDIGEALDAAKVNPVRIDALALGVLRERWGEIDKVIGNREEVSNREEGIGKRRVVLVKEADDIALFVMDGDAPAVMRSVAPGDDMRRSVMLALLEAEDFAGGAELSEIVVLGDVPREGLEPFGAPIREVACADDVGVAGVAERSLEEQSLNVLPESWQEMLDETRFKAKLVKFLAIAGGIWLLVMGILFGVPIVYGYMVDHQKALMKEHSRKYQEVREMREKVRLVQKYSDHSRGALEIMKAISDRLPEGVELTSWNFKRDEGVKFSGEATAAPAVYQLKNQLLEMAEVGEDGEPGERIFADVRLTGPTKAKGKERFDIECLYEKEEE